MVTPSVAETHSRPGKVDICSLIRIATWNVLTLAHTRYLEAIVDQLLNYCVSLVGLMETGLQGSGVHFIDRCTLLHSGGCSHTSGVALVLDRRFSGSLVSWSPVSDRLLCACLVCKHSHLSVIMLHHSQQPMPTRTFYQQPDSLVSTVPPHDIAVILGDFSAVTASDRHGFESVIGHCGSGCLNNYFIQLLSLCAAHNLSVLGSWFKRKDIYRNSWICNDGHTRKELDHILTNNRLFFRSLPVFWGAEPILIIS